MTLTSTSRVIVILFMLRRRCGQNTGKAATIVAILISITESPIYPTDEVSNLSQDLKYGKVGSESCRSCLH